MSPQSVLFIGGGSIGHIAPGIAVARALLALKPDIGVHFIVSTRPEDVPFVEQAGFPVSTIDAPRLSWRFPFAFVRAVHAARRLLQETNPTVIFSKGGYVSVPVCLAARRMRIPIILHESDAVSGWANRLVGRWASVICTGFAGSVKNPKAICTGIPIREDMTAGSRQRGLAITGLSRIRPVLLVVGGSQGALELNRAIARHLPELLEHCEIIHLTGRGKETVAGHFPGYWQCPFAVDEYPHLFAAADLALSRAGATTLMELAAVGLPAILVPLEGVAHDHQRRNAEIAVQSGGCILLEQGRLPASLVPTVRHLIEASDSRRIMANAIRALHHPDATRQIAAVIARQLA
ncbi:MAG: UDP-N-acetylglucosamine--N-acetylmuramyl-(pentapeptide) pyrophosphoryl-undecaprenol N-acetylglucosamine transferase [Candidatus Peribacteraceae bacterium]|nr:UDP-N-acetylglucosamine--N-acetylmuramyl-(pentapeptide) pyrophosphoryl-undecaprenol N-acetylglucosamine transferase [Candidatus Peribacteraceae bacterium]MDD5741873.1 UDP-N-acetylglucosamine--N-acetylmuramyl-(pentapeptide) pyrophosphoryl-undecaprenol N-acetylglucosamine transferase [Candidatus Peribacteraceae bacterium]